MLELKPLYYFDAAFRAPSLREAATELGIAVSSLSESMNSLEEKLGMVLFERAGRELRPTSASYWLFREVFAVLTLEGFITNYARRGRAPFRTISIHLDTSFSIGRLPVAIAYAIRAMAIDEPDVHFAINWDCKGSRGRSSTHSDPAHNKQSVIEIRYTDYADSETVFLDEDKMHIIGNDTLMLLRRASLMSVSSTPLEPINLPHIPGLIRRSLMAKLKRRSDLKHIILNSPDAPVELIQALHSYDSYSPIIVPASSLSGRFRAIQDFALPLVPAFKLKLIAIMTGDDPAGLSFISQLGDAFAAPSEKLRIQPLITARQLYYFKLIQEYGSIKASAQAASVAHSAVTAQLTKLQGKITQPLFERRANRLCLTDAGRRFSQASELLKNALDKLRFTQPRMTKTYGSRIELGVLPGIGPNSFLIAKVTQAVEAWRMSHPQECLRISEEPNDSLRSRIRRGTLHLGVVAIKSRDLPRFDIGVTEPLGLVYTAQSNFVALNRAVSYDELAAIPLIFPTKQFGLRQLIDFAGYTRKISLRPVIEVESLSMCVAMVRGGYIATILPYSDIQTEVESGELSFSLIENPTVIRTLQVIYSSDRELTSQERDLIALLRIHLKS